MKKTILILLLLWMTFPGMSQFYNGLQMAFGKNRVQYGQFMWQYYRFSRFDTYYYSNGKELAQYTAQVAEKKLKELENLMGYTLEKRIIFLVYNNLSDFRQSNIGLISGNDNYNIGGVTRIIDNKVFLYFESDHRNFEKQINAAIAEVIVNEMLYGADLKTKVANNTLMSLPEWYIKGLISYLSYEWDTDIDNIVREGILTGKYEKFNRLMGQDAVYAGHSIWYFVAEKYGKKVIPNIIYLTRVSKNSESGFLYVLGLPVKYMTFEWLNFYDIRYYEDDKKRSFPEEQKQMVKSRRYRVYDQFTTSPDGKYYAWCTNQSGRYKIFLHDTETGKNKRIFKGGEKIEQINDYSYPVIVWHPSGKLLTFVNEQKGSTWLWYYDMETRTLDSKEMFNTQKILSYSFNARGNLLAMSALKEGQTDIYIYNNNANTYESVTSDLADDRSPVFCRDNRSVLFASNRKSDTLRGDTTFPGLSASYNVFLYTPGASALTQITNDPLTDYTNPFEIKNQEYLVLSNKNGITNRYIAKYDSVISHIDTTEHYRYLTRLKQLTNYPRNILWLNYYPLTRNYDQIVYRKGKYHINKGNISDEKEVKSEPTAYRKKTEREQAIADSLAVVKYKKDTASAEVIFLADTTVYDTTRIDFRNYYFEFEKNKMKGYMPLRDSLNFGRKGSQDLKNAFARPKLYMTSFYTNYFVSQIDFGFLNNTYQKFTGGAVYFNPGFNVFFKIGTNDLFENYKITGGVRFAGNFDSNEYLLTLEDLKGRWDKEWIFHRMATTNVVSNSILKVHTHELLYVLKYPFNQVLSAKGTLTGRFDRGNYLSTDIISLKKESENEYWGGVKAELIYDNTKLIQLNVFNGTRFKIFGELYNQINEGQSDLWVVGADFRHYQKIHRNLISASRIAGSTSFGSKRLIYYLGSVDNWINLSPKVSTFDQSVAVDYSRNYAYQTLATNMRGFTQNIRNGNSFVVYNQELRWPFVKYFVNRPINSDFIENLQFVPFIDVGSAWVGSSPYDEDNAYNREVVYNGPVTVLIDKDRTPFVYGYGFGFRTRMLGYFVRADWAWGVENAVVLPRIFYLSLSLDF